MTKLYGKTETEADAEKSVEARHIAKTIMDYGVSQAQILKIIYLLALELEDAAALREIAEAAKKRMSLNEKLKSEHGRLITE